MSWFRTREVASGVWLLAEPSHVNTWLVEGSERAVLLDTGLGVAPIRPVAKSLTSLPVSVVNTHYHFDHTGGNHEFDEIAIHEVGAPLLEHEVPREILDAYMGYTDRLIAASEAYRALDRDFFHLLTPDSNPVALPEGFDPSTWSITPTTATRTLSDGEVVELGERSLRVIHTPGHTADCICLLDERDGILFGGDTINTGPIYAQFPDSDISAFAASTARLAELENDVRFLVVHHFGRVVAEPRLLREIAAGFAQIEQGDVELVQTRDCIDTPVLEAQFGSFSVLLPDPTAPERTLAGAEKVLAEG